MAEQVLGKLTEINLMDVLLNLKQSIVSAINSIINNIAGSYNVEFVFFLSLIMGIIITRWNNPKRKYLFGAIATLLIYATLRWIGIPY